MDSTQEIQILTADYSAEYGRTSGGQIRIITKSGTSDFHGAAYEYFRNTAFNANTWTRNHTPGQNSCRRSTTTSSATTSAARSTSRANSTRTRTRFSGIGARNGCATASPIPATWTVPTTLMRQGDFSELLNPTQLLLRQSDGDQGPATRASHSRTTSSRRNQLSPNGLGILKAYPVPNLATPINGNQNFYAAAIHPQNQRKDTLAVDMNLTDKQRLQFRRMNYSFWEYQPLDGDTDRDAEVLQPSQPDQLAGLRLDHQPDHGQRSSWRRSAWMTSTSRWIRRTSSIAPRSASTIPYIFPQGKLIPTRIPTANMTNFSGLNGGPYPSHSSGPIYTLSDSLTWVKGSHTFKFGFAFERSGENDNDEINVSACPTCTNNQNGQFSFTDTPLRPADYRRGGGQCRAGPVRHVFGTGPARLHDLPRQHVRSVRAGLAGRSARSCTSTTACATPSSFPIRRCGAT